MPQSIEDALSYSSQWLDIIFQDSIDEKQAKWIITESKHNFAEHFHKGWLDYRKSVTEAGDWAAVEWTGSGAVFKDVLGREYIDCLGGYGMLNHGWSHPDVVAAVGVFRYVRIDGIQLADVERASDAGFWNRKYLDIVGRRYTRAAGRILHFDIVVAGLKDIDGPRGFPR